MHSNVLARILPPTAAADLATTWAAWKAAHGPDAQGFVIALHAQGKLDAHQLRDALASLDVAFSLGEPAETGERHQELAAIGSGTLGEVVVARDRQLNRTVAIKKLATSFSRDKRSVARFRAEAQVTAQLDHPGIVPVYGYEWSADGRPSYAMKLVRGRSLSKFLADARAQLDAGLPDADHALANRLALFLRVCDALAYAHARGVIHRDLKPGNVMIGAFHEVYLMDFGAARLLADADVLHRDAENEPTAAGTAVGTPSYMSPEQAQGRNDELDARSDQYGLGLMLFEIVSLKRPLPGKGSDLLVRAAQGEKGELSAYSAREPIPRELRAIIARATQIKPADRYSDVAALADDVRRFLRHEPVHALPEGPVRRGLRWSAKNRGVIPGIAFGVIGLTVGLAAAAVSSASVALQAVQWKSAQHEAHLNRFLGAISQQGQRIDDDFQADEELLTGIAFAADESLATTSAHRTEYLDFSKEAPPDRVTAHPYLAPVSLGFPDFAFAPGVDRRALGPQIDRLASLQPALVQALTRSMDKSKPLDLVIAKSRLGQLPMVWAYVATEDGILAGMPGAGVYPPAYDPRAQEWYTSTKGRVGPVWGSASEDESGMGLLVTCSMALTDPAGKFAGVAGVDVTIKHIIDDLLAPAGVDGDLQAALLDDQGNTVVRTGLKRHDKPPGPFPLAAEVLKAEKDLPTGTFVVAGPNGDELVGYVHLDALDWTYVVEGNAAEMLGPPPVTGS